MKNRLFSVIFACFSTLLHSQTRPNIIVIFSDDHALQAISAYGSPHIRTPNIDRIAAEGAIFRNTFCTNSICAPSRAVLLTGKYNHLNGQPDNRGTTRMDTRQDMFPKYLQAAGYQTSWIGKWHINNTPQYFDYWRVLPGQGSYYNPDFINMDSTRTREEGYATNIITDQALTWMDKGRDKSKPFCLVIGQKAPHREWSPDTTDLHAFDGKKFALPATFYDDYKGRKAAQHQLMEIKDQNWTSDSKVNTANSPFIKRMNPAQKAAWDAYYEPLNAQLDTTKMTAREKAEWKFQRYMHDYMACVLSLDRNIGRVLDYLDKNNMTENTVVIYSSDQGFYLGEHGWFDKRFMYEQSFRMPLVMRFPKKIKPNTSIESLVVNLDFAPTILNLAGLPTPKDMQGRSILPLIDNKKPKDWRKSVYYHYTEYPFDHRVMPHLGVRTEGGLKLIRFYGVDNFWEFYDLNSDPDEMNNQYDAPKYQKQIKEMKKELRKLAVQYDDKVGLKVLDEK
jgi:choline-sulfatase